MSFTALLKKKLPSWKALENNRVLDGICPTRSARITSVMGLLFDLESSAAMPGCVHFERGQKRRRHIEADTPIVPRAVAVSVWSEACAWLDEELPRGWICRLAIRANVIYARNRRFRQKIHGPDNTGRDWLWTFTRHWLAAMILKRSPQLYTRLPASYSIGRDLPDRRHGQTDCRR